MKVVIMAGGKGTRIASVNSEVPKPMIEINKKPVLEYQIDALKRQGCHEFIFVTGYLGNVIKEYFQDGSRWGIHIEYIEETTPLGTGGALFLFKDCLQEDFLLLNGDILFDIDLQRFYSYHKKCGGLATLFVHPNDHPYDSGILEADTTGKIINWLHKEQKRNWYHNCVNAGIHILSPEILHYLDKLKRRDLDRDILEPLIPTGRLYAYSSPEYVKDMGTPKRWRDVEEDLLRGKIKAKNLSNKQKAIFLDRDGTINEYVGFLKDIQQFKLLPGAAEALRRINASDYLAIVITNQPVIARGEVSITELENIHRKMETLLGKEGAYLDDIFYCPHHPDKGFEGEQPQYKKECTCRKPKPGLILEAAHKYNLDLSHSWMVGDQLTDVQTGRNAGCKTALIYNKEYRGTLWYPSLLSCVEAIVDHAKDNESFRKN